MGNFIDMAGWVMKEHGVPDSRLTVINQGPRNKQGRITWNCICECGKPTNVVAFAIRNGRIKSCGCAIHDSNKKKGEDSRKSNKYDLSGEYGIGWTSNTNREFYFDLEDYYIIKEFCWFEGKVHGMSVLRTKRHSDQKVVAMHDVLGFKGCDHINRNELDNRKENLRRANFTENCRNRGLRSDNKSGVIGVRSVGEKFIADIRVNKKLIVLGKFFNKEDAIKARLKAEKEYFGEFAPQQHLYEEYGIN